MTLAERDHNVVWHPCAQMKDYQRFEPLPVQSACGVYVHLDDGRKLIDAYSSWWCKNLGHAHPRLMAALKAQIDQFAHVGLPHTTSKNLVEFSEKLTGMTDQLNKVLFASDGSCAVEMALKLSLHARQILGQPHKNKVISLQNAYHGETLFTMAVSDLGIYRDPYASVIPEALVIPDLPYVHSTDDPLWQDASAHWAKIEPWLLKQVDQTTAIIVEPILQAAAGMLIYSADFLQRLANFAKQHHIHLIADEIMTGLGRVGRPFACQYAGIEPDMMCLGKGLTAGVIPLSATLLTDEIYQLFYEDYQRGHNFLHSHTHSGNALAIAVALECLNTMEEEGIYERTLNLQTNMRQHFTEIADQTGRLTNIRGIGGVIAADLTVDSNCRAGFEVYQHAAKLGALLRPLANTIYWCPPLTITQKELSKLAEITSQAIASTNP